MVKRYTPDTKIEDYCHPYETYTVAVMKESSTGQWVKLETYENVVAMHVAANIRMQNEIARLHAQLKEMIERNGNNHA